MLVQIDRPHRRLWIRGQRCHHGATGTLFAAIALAELLAGQVKAGLALGLTGGALMAHDWKDHRVWFLRGPGPDYLA